MGEGLIFPACNTLLAAWTPLKERSVIATLVYSGGMIGSVIGSLISGILLSNYGWTSVFYIFGGVSMIWLLFFVSYFATIVGCNFVFFFNCIVLCCYKMVL